MYATNHLMALFNIRTGEGRLVLFVLAYAILLNIGNFLVHTASYALFLNQFDAHNLAYVYVGVSIVATLISTLVLKLNERFSLTAVLIGVHIFLLLTLAGYRLALETDAPWLIFSLPIYFGVSNSMIYASFWNLLSRLYNLEQGKRLFGLLSSGEHIAVIVGGFLTPILVGWAGTTNLFLLAVLVTGGALALLAYILHEQAETMREPATEPGGERQQAKPGLLRNAYIRFICILGTLFIVSVYFVDNIFYSQVEGQFATEDQMAAFIGVFWGVMGVLSLVAQVFLTGRIISRFGIRAIIIATPAGLLATTILFSLVGTFTEWTVVLFWLATVASLYRLVLDAADSAAVSLMYQPLPPQQRTQAQTTIAGIVYPLSIGLAGVAILFFTEVLAFRPLQLSYVLLFLIPVWLLTAIRMGRAYAEQVKAALGQRLLGHVTAGAPSRLHLPTADRATLTLLQQSLNTPHAGMALYALETLTAVALDSLPAILPDALGHRAVEVRLAALDLVERQGITSLLPLIRERLEYEGSFEVRSASLRVLAALGDADVFDDIFPYLESANQLLAKGMIVGSLRSGALEGLVAAAEKIAAWINTADPTVRTLAAETLGEARIHSVYRPLLKLLDDEDPAVRRAALAAAGRVNHPRLWPAVIRHLATLPGRAEAAAALVAGDGAALPAIREAFSQPELSPEVLLRLVQVCGFIDSAEAADLLVDRLDYPDVRVRSQALRALNRRHYQAGDNSMVYNQVQVEAGQVALLCAVLMDIEAEATQANEHGPAVARLKRALVDAQAQRQGHVFLWLSFVYDRDLIRQVVANLGETAAADKRAYAFEVIETQLGQPWKELLLPLLEELTPSQRRQKLAQYEPHTPAGLDQRLLTIVTDSGKSFTPWLKACALDAAAELRLTHLAPAVTVVLSAADPLVRETAVNALARLAPSQLPLAQTGKISMLSPIEKIMLLKAVPFLADAPEEVLAEIASLLVEQQVVAGESILSKDQVVSALYIVASGRVALQDGWSAPLEAGDVFGELAVFDPAPQPAAIAAITNVSLLRLDQELLQELTAEHSQIGWRIMQRLAQRARRAQAAGRAGQPASEALEEITEKLLNF